MSNLSFVSNQKGKKLKVFDGYLHSLHRFSKNECVWRCVEFTNFKCNILII